MKQKINLRPFFLFLIGILFALPAMAAEYLKTVTVLQQGQVVPVEDFYLNPPNDNKPSRVRVKNGVEFYVQLPEGHQIESLSGGVLEGDRIKVSQARTLSFFFFQSGVEKYVRVHVNYFGVLQYNGSDAPETIEVTQENENEKVYFPPKIDGVRWFGLRDGQLTHLSEIPDGTPEVTLGFLKNSGFTEFKVRNRDGTSNELPDGTPGGESWNKFSITVPAKQYTVTLSAQPTNGGTVSGEGKFEENTEVTVVATPKEGWKFIRWTESGTEVSTSSSYSFPITKNRTLVAQFEKIPPKQYTVTLSAQPSDGGTVSGAGKFEENTEVTVVATPKEGWKFIRWTESGTEVSTSASYAFPITKNRTLVAQFEKIPPKQYTVTLSAQPNDGGTVSGAGKFEENTQVTVVATPKEGWRFIRWTESGTEVSTSASYAFPITKNRTLVAHFEKIPPKQYTVTLSAQPNDGGTVSGAGKFEENTQVTVVATPKEGWRFIRWTESGTEVSTSASYSFPITKNRTLVAHFEKIPPKQYTVTLSANPTNGGTVSGAGKFEENTQVTVVATPKEGWKFIRWTESGTEVSTSSSYTFPITKNRTLVAQFEKIPPKQYIVTLSAQPNDGGTVSGAGKFEENTQVTVVATPKEGWKFIRWTESGMEVSTSASYAFPITKNRTLVAHFEKIPPKQYTVTLSAQPTEGGTVSGAGKFEENTQVTVVATPKEGWRFVRWTESGMEVSTSASYSFPITNNRTLVAHFEKIPPKQYTVTLSAQPSEGGTVSGAGKFEENTEVTVVATPKEGWRFIRWTESGTEVSTSASYSFPITKNRTLVAQFEKIPPKQYTVTLSAQPTDGGTVSGEGRFEENTQVTIVATPKEGWKFIRWTESGTEVSTSASYAFPITKNRTLVAHFEKIPPKQYTVTLSAQPTDGGTVSGAGKFEENTEVTVVATPKEGWKFIRWTESGTEVSTSASYSFPITNNRTLVAHFEKIPPKQYTVTLSAQPNDGGTVSGAGKFEENTQVTVVATPKEGWRFVRWTESGTEVSTSASYSFPITNNRTLVAHFEKIPPKQYTVTLSAQPAEGGTVSGAGRFEENTQVTVVATPKEGWKFIRWTESGTEVSTSASYSFPITNNRTLVAHFEKIPPKQYTVTLSAQPNDGGTVSGAGKFEENTQVTVVATPKEGWRFVRWTESGTEVSTSASYSFPITNNRTLVAHFEKIPPKQYTVTLSAQPAEGGTVSGAGRFEENTQVTVVATPKEGWKFIRWTESGTEVSTSVSYSFPITKNRTLVAQFEKIPPKQYTVTLSAQPTDGGTVSGEGRFEENTQVTVVATPKEGWRFIRWTESGTEVSTSASYSFPITKNRTLVAQFEKIPPKQYTVTLSANPTDGGTVSGEGRFEENTQVTVVATPKEGWKFIRWTESGTEVSTSVSYSFRITSNLNLVAVFEKIPIDPEQLLPHLIGLGSTPIKRGEIKTYLWEDLHEDVANFNFKLFTTEDNSASTGIKVNKLNANEVELQFVEEGKFTLVIEFEVNGKNFYLSYDLTVEN